MADVATIKLFENDKVIVWDLVLEPGESTGMHTHELDYLIHIVEGSTLSAIDGDGSNPRDVPLKSGETHYFSVKDGVAMAGDLKTNATHDAKNVGPGRYREIMVEIK